jgi:hypothetical protein
LLQGGCQAAAGGTESAVERSMSVRKSPGRQAWELALQQMDRERQLLKLQVDHVSATSPDKEPFAIDALAAVYPMRLAPAQLSAAAIEELRAKYYLFFPGKTLAEYADHLIYHDMHDSN